VKGRQCCDFFGSQIERDFPAVDMAGVSVISCFLEESSTMRVSFPFTDFITFHAD
jgi:hypothetical protein